MSYRRVPEDIYLADHRILCSRCETPKHESLFRKRAEGSGRRTVCTDCDRVWKAQNYLNKWKAVRASQPPSTDSSVDLARALGYGLGRADRRSVVDAVVGVSGGGVCDS